MSIDVKVLGSGCSNCRRLYAEAEKAVTQLSATRHTDEVGRD